MTHGRQYRCASLTLFFLFAIVVAFQGLAAAADPPGVLILHSYQRPDPGQIIVEDTLRTTVSSGFRSPVTFYSENLDDDWASVEIFAAREAELLQAKYALRNIRVIVVAALPALRFAIQFRDRIFAGVPVVYVQVACDRVDANSFPAGFVGNFEDNDPTPTLQLALRLHPATNRLVLVRGASEFDRHWETRMRAAAAKLESGVSVEYLSGPTADMLAKVAALPIGTVVFSPGYFIDGTGVVTAPRQSIERIAGASAVPVYGAFDPHIGAGIVGGYMTRFEDQAKEAGGIVIQLLTGVDPGQIAPGYATRVPIVDWRQVRRWDIDERLLPTGTIVRFREPTLVEKYWREISMGIAIIFGQAILIAALIWQRRKRRIAEVEVQRQRTELGRASRLATLGELSASIAHEVNQPLGAIASNVDAVELLLDAEPPKLEDAKRVLLDLKRANQRASDVVLRIRELLRKRELAFERYELNAAATEIVRLLETDAIARGVEVRTEFQSLPLVRGDRLQFQQVLLNLLVNGMDAMAGTPVGRRLLNVRTLHMDDRSVEIAVADSGGGIDAADMSRLFDSFFTTKKDGMGLGLALCRSIVQAHGGRIWAENSPGGGATFRFALPVDAEQRLRVLSSRRRGIIER